MYLYFRSVILISFIIFGTSASAKAPANFLFLSSGDVQQHRHLLQRNDIAGVQIVYTWKMLEKKQGQYDFSQIEEDLQFLNRFNKKLFIQIQDRFFEAADRNIPSYLLTEKVYCGGLAPQADNPGENKPQGSGWVTMHWNPAVKQRFQYLLAALAKQFDGRVYGVNLPETSIDIKDNYDGNGFSCEKYFQAELSNMKFAKTVFRQSYVVQYVNFFPCEWDNDHQFMSRLFKTAEVYGIGLGGPDIVPGKKAQMKNAYPFFNRYKGKLKLVAMAVQEPTLTYTNPVTKKPFTKDEFIDYAERYLGVNIIFWSSRSPWLQH